MEQPEALTFDEMQTIHEAILKNGTITDTDFQDAWQSILQAALRYTTIRAQWHSFSQDENERSMQSVPPFITRLSINLSFSNESFN